MKVFYESEVRKMEYEVDIKELKKAMIDHDFDTYEEVSNASGVNINTICSVFNGKIYPSSSVMIRLGTVFGFSDLDMGRIFFKQKLASDASKQS